MRVEISAGGVVYRKNNGEIEVGFILDPYGKWTFPKGHVEKKEKTDEAAEREAEEEMGIPGLKVREYLGKADFWFKDRYVRKGELVHKFLHYYLIEAPAGAIAKPQKKEKIQEVAWLPLNKAYAKSDYRDIEPLLRKAITRLGGQVPPVQERNRAGHKRNKKIMNKKK